MQHLYSRSLELHRRFPDPAGDDLTDFLRWLAITGQDQHGLANIFLAPSGQKPSGSTSVRRRLRSAASHAWTSQTSRRLKQWTKKRLGPERTGRLKESVRPSPPIAPLSPPRPDLPTIRRPGINLIGYLEAESGMGQGARALSHAIEKAEIPLSLQSLDLNVLARQQDRSIGAVRSNFPWDINLVFVNADQVEPAREHLGGSVFAGRYNVGFWLWELEQFPAALQGAFSRFHEIWTPSRFCLEALSAVSPIPVRRVPFPVETPQVGRHGRSHFGLPEEPFIFLFVFDFLSHVERKNPDGVVEAFREAFGDREDVLLVLKASHTEFDATARRRLEQVGEANNIRWIAEEIDRGEVDDLIWLCDCYVSLHRSEGLGLTLAEALTLDRPVIATDYSGSTDLLHSRTGFPVGYELVELEHDVGPYESGARWANPNIPQAAELMRWVFEHPEEAALISRRGGEETRERYGLESVSRILRERFDRILAAAPTPSAGGPGPHRPL
jgi:glycosyltransferase involved in cell wall biosynthesis